MSEGESVEFLSCEYAEDTMVVSVIEGAMRIECVNPDVNGETECAVVALSKPDQERLFQFLGKVLGKDGFEWPTTQGSKSPLRSRLL